MVKDSEHPFFRPLWRRIALVAFTGAWTIVEWVGGDSTWGTITAGVCAYSVWTFLIAYPKHAPEEPK